MSAEIFVKSGKVKDVYREGSGPGVLVFHFSDRISVFDQKIPSSIPNKGQVLATTSAHWFKMCDDHGIMTHFLNLTEQGHMRVAEMDVTPSANGARDVPGKFIPLEFILRWYIAGSMWDRIEAGKVTAQDLGFPSGHKLKRNERLPEPFFEVTTKFEHTDRPVSGDEALGIGGITKETMNAARELLIRTDELMQAELTPRGVVHVDGKKELAISSGGKLMLVDTFGNPDEDRFWYQEDLDRGKPVERSKEFVRQHYRDIGHKDMLDFARKDNKPEPPIPPLPKSMVVEVSALYADAARRLTGEEFNPRQVA